MHLLYIRLHPCVRLVSAVICLLSSSFSFFIAVYSTKKKKLLVCWKRMRSHLHMNGVHLILHRQIEMKMSIFLVHTEICVGRKIIRKKIPLTNLSKSIQLASIVIHWKNGVFSVRILLLLYIQSFLSAFPLPTYNIHCVQILGHIRKNLCREKNSRTPCQKGHSSILTPFARVCTILLYNFCKYTRDKIERKFEIFLYITKWFVSLLFRTLTTC